MDLKECLIIGSFCVLILARLSFSENFELSSSPSVIGTVGQDAVLPCQISLGTQPQNMEILQWKKIGDKHVDDIYQFTAVTGQETFGPGYQARALLASKEGMATGNVSLKLKKVQVSDGGIYGCIVKSSRWVDETRTVLHITAFGNVSIEVLGPEGEGIKLACRSAGWFPEPKIQWLAKSSQNSQFESKQDHEQLFSVWSYITVMRDTGEITCSVYERSSSQMKREITILLSQNIFPDTSSWHLTLSSSIIVIIIILLVLLRLAGVALYCIYKVVQMMTCMPRADEEWQSMSEGRFIQDQAENGEDEDLNRILGFTKARSCLVHIHLDPEYKHPQLEVSPEHRRLYCKLVSSEAATTSGPLIIAGTEGFQDGRQYWEVEVEDEPNWEVGVLRGDARDKLKGGKLSTLEKEQYWSLKRLNGKYYPEEVDHKIQEYNYQLQRIGIYLDREEGNVSFYDVRGMQVIVKIPVNVSEKLYPFFSAGLSLTEHV